MTRPELFYDQDCGFCRWSTQKVLAWSRDRIEAVPLQGERADRALAGMEPSKRLDSWHLRLPDGSLYSAGRAVPELLRFLPGMRWLAPIARPMWRPIDAVYRIVARNRHRLSRLLGEQACAVDPSRATRKTEPSDGSRSSTSPGSPPSSP